MKLRSGIGVLAAALIASASISVSAAAASGYGLPCGAGICDSTPSGIAAAKAWARWETSLQITRRTGTEPRPTGRTRCRHTGRLRYRCKVTLLQGENLTWKATATLRFPGDNQCLGHYDIRATRLSPAAMDPAVSHSRWRGTFGCEA